MRAPSGTTFAECRGCGSTIMVTSAETLLAMERSDHLPLCQKCIKESHMTDDAEPENAHKARGKMLAEFVRLLQFSGDLPADLQRMAMLCNDCKMFYGLGMSGEQIAGIVSESIVAVTKKKGKASEQGV